MRQMDVVAKPHRQGGPIRYRGTVLSPGTVQSIRQFVRRHPARTRLEVARRVSQFLGWRRPNGELAERSCMDLLLRLAERGLVRLPPPIRARPVPRTSGAPDLCSPLSWPAVPGSDPGDEETELVVRPIHPHERKAWRQYIARLHYLGYCRLVGESICYVALRRGEVVALIGWGAAALKNSPRDTYLGWDWPTKTRRLFYVVNNVRYLVVPWVQEKNLASRILALNLKRLSRDWQRRYDHPIYLAETFVDPARFRGTCYRASNWIEVGQTGGWSRNGPGYEHHGQPKIVFVYPLHRRARSVLNRPEDQELHHQEVSVQKNVAQLDVSKLPLAGQGGLFDVLHQITDSRKRRGVRHPLVSVLAFAVCATLAGMQKFAAIAQWAAEQTAEVRELLGCHRRAPAGERTFRRVLGSINAAELDEHLGVWISKHSEHGDLRNSRIALDGKTLRGSGDGENPPIQLLSAILHNEGLVVAQSRVSDKTNEIPVAQAMLKSLDIEGSVITGDALHTQKETTKIIVEEKKAGYVFTVKDNQPSLNQAIADLDWSSFSPSGRNG